MASFKKVISIALATGFGVGYLPLGPGTWGSLGMGFLCWWFLELPLNWYLAIAGAVFLIGVMTVPLADRHFFRMTKKESDNNQIVIDEFLGMMITLVPLLYFEKTWLGLGVGFILFRFFDIFKFGLARFFDNFKNQWGVMLDDLLAGAEAGLVLFIILWLVEFF